VVVLVDREQGGAADLAAQGYQLHAVLGLKEMLTVLVEEGRIMPPQEEEVLAFLERGKRDA
jgi:orotate phosphoribosyltransferase